MRRIVLSALACVLLSGAYGTALGDPASMAEEADQQFVPLSHVAPAATQPAADVAAQPEIDPLARAIAERLEDPAFRDDAGDARTVAAVADFYDASDYRSLWIEAGRLTPAATALIDRLARAGEDGLDPTRYATPNPRLGMPRRAPAHRLAEAELKLTLAAIAYARDAQGGRVDPTRLGRNVTAKPTRPAPARILEGLAESTDPAAYVDGFNPRHPAFHALRETLAALREADARPDTPRVPDGALLRPGMEDERVPVLRARLGLTDDDSEETDLYDPGLVTAVEAFQEQSGLVVDGIVGPATLRALNSARDVTVADVVVNMERWRWLPPDMGGDHYVWVNIPEFRVRVVTEGETVFDTRAIVGRQDRQTPIFSDEIEYLEVNPYWNVPRSIASKDLLPDLQRDPLSLYRRGIQVFYTGEGRPREIDPRTVDWNAWAGRSMPFHFRQVPSEVNALGRVKFMFPNEHAVYLHDTPSRSLFNRSARMFSSGCVRVEDPVAFADAMLALEADVDGARVERLIAGGRNGAVSLKRRVPVHLTYFTVWVDESGNVQLRDDIYGHDRLLSRELGLTDTDIAM